MSEETGTSAHATHAIADHRGALGAHLEHEGDFADVQDRFGKVILSVRDQNTFATELRKKRLMTRGQ